MKIGTFVRTFRDFEESHIQAFIESHLPFSDMIYIGVCQTSDTTIRIASKYPNVKMKYFGGSEFGLAHEGRYYKFLSDWASEEDIDICIFDDADHIANPALQRDARCLIEQSDAPFFYTLLMYVWGTDFYFPRLNDCNPSERLWGWNVHKWTPDINPEHPYTVEIRNQPDARQMAGEGYTFPHPPYTLLHFSFLTEEITQRKMAFNHARGVAQAHPLESCGELLPLPEWATT